MFLLSLSWGRWREGNKTECSQFFGVLYDKVEKKACRAYKEEKKETVKLLELGS